MCSPTQSYLLSEAASSAGPDFSLNPPQKVPRGIPSEIQSSLLYRSQKLQPKISEQTGGPKTRIFFSGSLFPLATLSNMEDHMSFFASPLFGLSWSLEAEICVCVDVLSLEEAIVALDWSQEGFN